MIYERRHFALLFPAALLLAAPRLPAQVVINEVHYAPPDKTLEEEFVELHNAGLQSVALAGWTLGGAVDFTFPAGTTIAAGGYLVVAQDPAALARRFGPLAALGPFTGRLSNQGEDLILRNAAGARIDEVDYQRGFPWPNLGGSGGYSMELIHPALDNQLGGSWRASNPGLGDTTVLIEAGSQWRYRKGTSEASTPAAAWRVPSFNDAGWLSGRTSLGYGESFIITPLGDMQGGYSSVFLRKTFQVDDPAAVGSLRLEVQFDDGFNAWINGVHVAGSNLAAAEMPFDGVATSALEDLTFNDFIPPPPAGYLIAGTNVLALQLHNSSLGGSSDAFIDVRLLSSPGSGAGPTPGAQNSVFAANAPPQLRQLALLNDQPVAGEAVHISVRATDDDGVASVTLEYQAVDPGSYIRRDDPEYETNWTAVAMNDDGFDGDLAARDGVYSVLLPESLQTHRRLVRYRLTAVDGTGLSVNVPYPDDPQPNFAYFVYNGVPGWRGASRPGSTPLDFSPVVMRALPVYHLIARETDVINSQYVSSYDGVHFQGTLVYDGTVHDHIEFENRGEYSTYVSGKNKWRFHMRRGHEFQARDDFGREYRERWRTVNLSAVASPWVETNRGMAGLDEGLAFKLYGLAGIPSPKTNFLQFRIIDEAVEAQAGDQYRGDLWGLYMTIEHPDGSFLDERGLPDGNTYKIEGGGGDKHNQGPTQPTGSSDYDALRAGFGSTQPVSWWRANVDMEGFYSFRAVNIAVNNMDLREGWNHFQYHNPETNLWTPIAWDLDMLFMPVTHWSGIIDFERALGQSELRLESRNRSRELKDLLFAPLELAAIVDEFAAAVNPPGRPLTAVDIDEAMWNYHPRASSSHRGAFYRNPSTHSAIGGTITRTLVSANHEGMVQWVKDFMLGGYGANRLTSDAADAAIPDRPALTARGDPRFPVDDLRFETSPFTDPQGPGTFGAMEWRLAEITPAGAPPPTPPGPRRNEIDPVWESGELPTFASTVQVPSNVARAGHRYRARVRMRDTSRRWSRWSEPVEFMASEPLTPFPQTQFLRITEIMYHAPEGQDHDFIELKNVGGVTVDLRGVSFTEGIEFSFAGSDVEALGPGEIAVVVAHRAAFRSLYGAAGINIAGEYSGSLANGGERLVLGFGTGAPILDFAYADSWYPLTDGGGRSLVIVDALGSAASWGEALSWAASADDGGSPGADEGGPPPGGRQLAGDSNQDGALDVADAVSLLLRLFPGADPAPLPCAGTLSGGGNLTLLDLNGDAILNLVDVLHLLNYLVRSGPPPSPSTTCFRIEGCPNACGF